MDANEKELKSILVESTPILFLGAGFSIDSKNDMGKLPKGDGLRKDIFDIFIDDSFNESEKKEIREYNLQELCQHIYVSMQKKDELQKYIVSRFKDSKPAGFHLLLNRYPWKKIYTVNVDDLVENIYKINGVELIVQNKKDEKKCIADATELFKLHGCVNELEEGLVFSQSEYTNLISKRNFKLDSLTTDMLKQNIIFVGASMDESDIDFYISKYEDAGFQLRKGKLIFIDPFPNLKLKTRIKAMGGILLEWTTEQFLKFVSKLNYNPTELEASKKALNYAGFYLYRDILAMNNREVYESKLYEGYACKWDDVIDDWVFETESIKELEYLCKSIITEPGKSYCISIFGNRFTGKDCALKYVGAFLYKSGYTVIEFKGRFFDIMALKRYIESCPQEKIGLLVEDAPFLYRMIETILQMNWGEKSLLIITTSRTYYHFKKRYYLEGNPYYEIELTDKINNENAKIIYNKLKQKGYTGALPREEKKAITEIQKKDSFVNLFSDLTYGKGFRRRLNNATENIVDGDSNIFNLYLDLVIFDRADLGYFPSELFIQQYDIDLSVFFNRNYKDINSDQKNIIDFLRIDENGLVLKNRLYVDMLWKRISKKQILDELFVLLSNISSYVSENANTYWRIIFESLLKEDALSKKFQIKKSDILKLYYKLKDYYSEISYYWLQLGIAEQSQKEYSKALNHLLMAQKIKPRAYQIHHAIARNYLKHANEEKNIDIALELFSMGEKRMLELINSREDYKTKARNFSIHCFVHEKIRFYNKHPELIDKRECKKMKVYIDMIINEKDSFVYQLIKEYMCLLEKNDLLNIISLKPNDLYFIALSGKSKNQVHIDNYDILVDSY